MIRIFSPFGDITTLMVWQKGVIPFFGFFSIIFIFIQNPIRIRGGEHREEDFKIAWPKADPKCLIILTPT